MKATDREDPGFRIGRAELDRWLDALLAAGHRVLAPQTVPGKSFSLFRTLAHGKDADLRPGRTRWSPREALQPRSEPLFRWETVDGELALSDPPLDPTPQVLFGVRPCDAAGLQRAGAVLGSDPQFAHRRNLTTIVTLGCDQAQPGCFCTAVGGSPHGTEGSDLELAPDGDGWLGRALTPAGRALLCATSFAPATAAQWQAAGARAETAAAGMTRQALPPDAAAALEAAFDDPHWAELARECLGCQVCGTVCPSCTCFDVHDDGGLGCGERCRSQDSCTQGLFTAHATGHNPRPTQGSRYRQRALHKFAFFPARHGGASMCVGCGRCIEQCPVGIDIHHVVQAVLGAREEVTHVGR